MAKGAGKLLTQFAEPSASMEAMPVLQLSDTRR
jgi:hypothetical protein